MEYIYLGIIGFLIILVSFLIFIVIKKTNKVTDDQEIKNYLKDENNKLKLELYKLINESNQFNQNELFKTINNQFDSITNKVNTKISDSFKKTDETFVNVVERLTKIDEQNKFITKLSNEVLTLNNILTDKSTRGIFGEVQLYKLLESILGNNKELYETQKTLSNGSRVDAVIYAPKPLGMLSIDSKFPLENYQKMTDSNLSDQEKELARKQFILDIKKHINDIKNKYIIENETAAQAIMFIPAESIFLEIVSNHSDLFNYAYQNNVLISSPTTLISSISIIETVSNNIKQSEQTTLIIDELKALAVEFKRYKDRWELLSKRIEDLNNDINNINTTTKKIHKRFIEIESGKLD